MYGDLYIAFMIYVRSVLCEVICEIDTSVQTQVLRATQLIKMRAPAHQWKTSMVSWLEARWVSQQKICVGTLRSSWEVQEWVMRTSSQSQGFPMMMEVHHQRFASLYCGTDVCKIPVKSFQQKLMFQPVPLKLQGIFLCNSQTLVRVRRSMMRQMQLQTVQCPTRRGRELRTGQCRQAPVLTHSVTILHIVPGVYLTVINVNSSSKAMTQDICGYQQAGERLSLSQAAMQHLLGTAGAAVDSGLAWAGASHWRYRTRAAVKPATTAEEMEATIKPSSKCEDFVSA